MTGSPPRPQPGPEPPPQILAHWDLRPDGAPRQGYMAAVWPVLGPAGQRWVVKIPDPHHPPTGEAEALKGWAAGARSGPRIVHLVDDLGSTLLLERLDPVQSLAVHPDVDVADRVLAQCLADLGGVGAPAQTISTVDELVRVQQAIERHLHAHDRLGQRPLPTRQVDAALATLGDLTSDASLRLDRTLVHFDLHHDNVLRDLEDTRWVVIDPLPHAGLREIELVAPLRNRWADVRATGAVDAALRRRLHLLSEAADLDPGLARMVAQAVAVDNLLWLLPDRPDDLFVEPYRALARWI